MTLEQFASIQRSLIEQNGFADFLPTLWQMSRPDIDISVLRVPPQSGDVAEVVLDGARSITSPGDECFVAFKLDDARLKVIRRMASGSEEAVITLR